MEKAIKFSIENKQFVRALKTATKVINRKNALPILSSVKLTMQDGRLNHAPRKQYSAAGIATQRNHFWPPSHCPALEKANSEADRSGGTMARGSIFVIRTMRNCLMSSHSGTITLPSMESRIQTTYRAV